MMSALAPAVVILASVPLVLKLVPRNGVYGFRTRRTVESDEVWYPANRAAGIAMIVAAVVWRQILSDRYGCNLHIQTHRKAQ